jgi:hypothetical protein
LQIADEINLDLIYSIEENFKNSKNELLMSKKNQFRTNITELLRLEYFENERSQYEFDMMVWRVFSKFSIAEQSELANINTPLFKRSLRVTSSVVIGAYLLGYYDETFLETIFTKSIKKLMNMVNKDKLTDEVKKLEKLRKNFENSEGFSEEIKALFDLSVVNSEVPTWEKLLVIFNSYYSFEEHEMKRNILYKINKEKISIDDNKKYFQSFHKHESIPIRLISRYAYLYLIYYFEPNHFPSEEIKKLILETSIEIQNHYPYELYLEYNFQYFFLE